MSSYDYIYDDRGYIIAETTIESLAGYAYDDKHDGKHEDGKHDKDAAFVYQIIETNRTFTYGEAGKLLSMTEDEENYGLYTTRYEYN
ncbi:hypothetical protein LJC58_10270, partial [Lachnospiraceae bacterium OttesenSCG-928-D06]|nr:hypothetical protein [Lachnospiraceae bacterium OttesenSCG-928-D06]